MIRVLDDVMTIKNVHSGNLVLGIDEYLINNRKNMNLELIMIKKFYQRIFKSTGNDYLNYVCMLNQI